LAVCAPWPTTSTSSQLRNVLCTSFYIHPILFCPEASSGLAPAPCVSTSPTLWPIDVGPLPRCRGSHVQLQEHLQTEPHTISSLLTGWRHQLMSSGCHLQKCWQILVRSVCRARGRGPQQNGREEQEPSYAMDPHLARCNANLAIVRETLWFIGGSLGVYPTGTCTCMNRVTWRPRPRARPCMPKGLLSARRRITTERGTCPWPGSPVPSATREKRYPPPDGFPSPRTCWLVSNHNPDRSLYQPPLKTINEPHNLLVCARALSRVAVVGCRNTTSTAL
jgi:hypothetical protein